jgi:hypothetical protein
MVPRLENEGSTLGLLVTTEFEAEEGGRRVSETDREEDEGAERCLLLASLQCHLSLVFAHRTFQT